MHGAGFVNQRGEHVRFAGCTAVAVDLASAEAWGLPESELATLFEQASPVEGFVNLSAPAAHHRLLIAARRTSQGEELTPAHRRRLQDALTADPAAWRNAERRAAAWRVEQDLRAVRRAIERDARVRGLGQRTLQAAKRACRPRVLALSGVDGSGKSTQARALQASLEQLGYDAAIVWTPLASNRWLARLARSARRLLHPFGSLHHPPNDALRRGRAPNPASVLRQRNPLVNHAWATLVALANGLSHRRSVVQHAVRGRVVICDRYVLDSVARLHFFYGEAPSFRLQRGLIARLSPRPTRSFFLDLPSEASAARKDDGWSSEELGTQVRLYREEHAILGAIRLDASEDHEQLCAQIAHEAWRSLG